MKVLHMMLGLLLILQIQIRGQGSFGQHSESQILELIKEARIWTNPEARWSDENKVKVREFLDEHKPFLDSLGKTEAFYYLRMIEQDKDLQSSQVSDLAYSARCIFWWHRDEYTEEEKTRLEQAKLLLDPDPEVREIKDDIAKRAADVAVKRKLTGTFNLSKENALEAGVATPPSVAPSLQSKPAANQSPPTASESVPSPLLATVILIVAAAIIFFIATLFKRPGKES